MNNETLLYRQVHPLFVHAGEVTSQVFRPTPKDEGKLSVYDGDLIAPDESWRHYTSQLGLPSCGVLAVSVAECEALGLSVESDPVPYPAHAVIVFEGLSRSARERKSDGLRKAAISRGWRHRANEAAP